MISRKEKLAKVLDCVGALTWLLRLKRFTKSPHLPILTYHSVSNVGEDYPFDPNVINASLSQFQQQLELINRYFNVITTKDLVAAYNGGPSLPPNPIMITFDDGYLSNRQIIMPMLAQYGFRGVFFIATGYITHRKIFWWDRINYLVRRSKQTRVSIKYPFADEFLIDQKNQTQTIERLLQIVKTEVDLDLERFMNQLTEACDVPWTTALEKKLANQLIMSWDDVQALEQAGMDVQSHTRWHRVLQTLAPNNLDEELRGSKQDLQRQLDRMVKTISFPVGPSIRNYPKIMNAISAAGYSLGFSCSTGVNANWRRLNPFDISRVIVAPEASTSMFLAEIAVPMFSECTPSHM